MECQNKDFRSLRKKAEEIRYNLVAMMDYAASGHPGGSLSMVEILTELYYGGFIKNDPNDPKNPERDRFVMSKGHASPTQYVILADLGFYPKETLKVFDKDNSMLPKHCNHKLTPGVDASTGALGQGMSMALGMALAGRMDDAPYTVYCALGDGECQSGEIWEAAMAAAKYKLGNLKVILDNNGLQIDGKSDDIMPLGDIKAKWEAFGWKVFECDGHSLEEIDENLNAMCGIKDAPALLIANTVKGKGVSFMENEVSWHGKAPDDEQYEKALRELGALA